MADRMTRAERLDQLAGLLEQDLALPICAERMGYASHGTVYPLFNELKLRTFGPRGLSRDERRELRKRKAPTTGKPPITGAL